MQIHVDHPLPTVVGVANQPLAFGINHEIEQLQGDHTDENRAIISETSSSVSQPLAMFSMS